MIHDLPTYLKMRLAWAYSALQRRSLAVAYLPGRTACFAFNRADQQMLYNEFDLSTLYKSTSYNALRLRAKPDEK